MSIENLIQREVQTIRADESCTKAALAMRDANVGSLVVSTEEDIPIGIVTDRDLVVRALADDSGADLRVRDVMTSDPIFLRESAPLDEVISTMRDLRLRRMIVVDEDQRLSGVVTMDDLVMHLGDTLAHLAQALHNELGR